MLVFHFAFSLGQESDTRLCILLLLTNHELEVTLAYNKYNLAPNFSAFLRKHLNKVFAVITGLEIPCTYLLYGPRAYIDKMKGLVKSLRSNGLL